MAGGRPPPRRRRVRRRARGRPPPRRAQHRHPGRRPGLGAARRDEPRAVGPVAALGPGGALRRGRRLRRRVGAVAAHRRADGPAGAAPRPVLPVRPRRGVGRRRSTRRCTRSAWATTPSRARPPSRSSSSPGPRRSTVLDVDLDSRDRTVLKRQPVLGDVDLANYTEQRVWATASDGTRIPVSLVHRVEVAARRHQPAACSRPTARTRSRPTPTSRWPGSACSTAGSSYAVAHVRGGGEMGRRWYDDGKLLAKTNTFTDTLACVDHLVAEGWVAPDRVGLEGGSAGGLLVGAVLNLAPEAFRVAHAAVPFVDALTTMLQPDLPLTVGEWEEWGNPLADPEVYAAMRAYAPYENVRAARLPGGAGDLEPARHPGLRHRAREVGGPAARDRDERPARSARCCCAPRSRPGTAGAAAGTPRGSRSPGSGPSSSTSSGRPSAWTGVSG